MTKYLLFIAFSACIVSCKPDELEVNCGDPYGASYEPIYIRLIDNNTSADLVGTGNYVPEKITSKQDCTDGQSGVTFVKGLINGSTDSIPLIRIVQSRVANGNQCHDFIIKWDGVNTDNYAVAFRDSVIVHDNGCQSHLYTQTINEDGIPLTQLNNIKIDAQHTDQNGNNTYYVIRK